jgi:hypothetical protein
LYSTSAEDKWINNILSEKKISQMSKRSFPIPLTPQQ